MKPATQSYLEHVAIRVRDIHWHIRFFEEVLGQTMREVEFSPEGDGRDIRQYWTLGGLQFMSVPDFAALPTNDAGWLAHLGVMVQDLDAALGAAQAFGVRQLPQGRNWLQLPDGLALELIQANVTAIPSYLAINPRA